MTFTELLVLGACVAVSCLIVNGIERLFKSLR